MPSSRRVHFAFEDEAPRYATTDSVSSAPSTTPPSTPPPPNFPELHPDGYSGPLPKIPYYDSVTLPSNPKFTFGDPPPFRGSRRKASATRAQNYDPGNTGTTHVQAVHSQLDDTQSISDLGSARVRYYRPMLIKRLSKCVEDNPVALAASIVKTIIEIKVAVGDNKDALTQSLELTRTMLEGVIAMPKFSSIAEDVINRYRSKINEEKENLYRVSEESRSSEIREYEEYKKKVEGILQHIHDATDVLVFNPQNEINTGVSTPSMPHTTPFLEGTAYWVAAERALKHARTQAVMISTIFGRYNIGESEYLVQAGFDESLIISGIGYLEQIHVLVSADLVDEVITNLATELGKIFSPFSSVLFTETSLYHLPVFLDSGMIREFDELVLTTASDIYHTTAAKSPLTAVSLSQASSSGAHNTPESGSNDGGKKSDEDPERKKIPNKGKKRDDGDEDEKHKDSPDPDDGPPTGSPALVTGSKRREIWFNVTSKIMAADDTGLSEATAFQTLVMDGTLIIEDHETQSQSFPPRRHAHFKALSFGSKINKSGNVYKQMHIRIVIDAHNKNARISDISPLKTSATDGKEIQTVGLKESRNTAYTAGLTVSALPSGSFTLSRGKNNEASTGSQITRNTSPITEYHNHGVIDWGFDINDPNSQHTGFDIDKTLLPTADFEFFGRVAQLPERMDFVIASHWSMILLEKPAGTQQRDQSMINTIINRARRLLNKERGQAVSYSNLLQIVGLKTNPSKLPIIHGYRATLDVQPRPNLQILEPAVDPDLPELDSTALDVRPATFNVKPSDSDPPARAAVNPSMFGEILKLSQNCIERFDALCTSSK